MKDDARAFLEQHGLGKGLVRDVEKIVELPDTGFIAGGAIASLILDRVFGGSHPVNDVDVFHVNGDWRPPGSRANLFRRPLRPAIEIDSYDHVVVQHKALYSVVATRRKGMLNTIFTRGHHDAPHWDDLASERAVLEGFDVNCCQVGVTRGGRLVHTDAFADFLRTGQIRVSYPGTPHHTAIRLAKKAAELKFHCDLAGEISLLATFADLMDRRAAMIRDLRARDERADRDTPLRDLRLAGYPAYFGAKYHRSCLLRASVLAPFAEAVPFAPDIPETLTADHPALRAELPDDGDTDRRREAEARVDAQIVHHRRFVRDVRDGKLFTMRYNVPSAAEEIAALRDFVLQDLDAAAFQSLWDAAFRPSVRAVLRRRAKTYLRAGNALLLRQALAEPGDFLARDVHEKHIVRAARTLKSHPRLHAVLLSADVDADGLAKSVAAVRRAAKRHGLLAIGLAETDRRTVRDALRSQPKKSRHITDEIMDELVAKFLSDNPGDLVSPADLDGFEHRDEVRELTTAADLLEEGCRMHHCVGGYAGAVRSGHCRIFHLRCDGEPSTLEIRRARRGDPRYHAREHGISQHAGRCNGPVGPRARAVAEALVRHLALHDDPPPGSAAKEEPRPEPLADGDIPF